MTRENDEWNDIAKAWKSDDLDSRAPVGTPDAKIPSNQELEAKVRNAVRSALIETVLGVTLGLALSVYILWEIVAGLPSAYDYVLYVGMLTIVGSVAFYSVWLRRSAWRSESEGTTAYLGLLLKQADSNIKVIRMGKLFGAVIVGLLYALAGWIAVQMLMSGNSIAKPGLASLIMGFVTLFFPAMIYVLHRKQKTLTTKRRHLESMLDGLR